MNVHLFYCNPLVRYGGHVTFTVHLMHALRAAGATPLLYKIHKRTESFIRDFGYGERYRNISLYDAPATMGTDFALITAPSKPAAEIVDALLDMLVPIVIHDPNEFKHGWSVDKAEQLRPIVIRKTVQRQVANSTFIPHPYQPFFKQPPDNMLRKPTGVTLSRIDFDKHTEMVLDANRKLPKRLHIKLMGAENRIYTRFKIMPNYPEFKQGNAASTGERVFERTLEAAPMLCAKYAFLVDMSAIKNDGGGTQYTFLEAIDGGAVCLLNEEWVVPGGTMQPGINCLAIPSGRALAGVIRAYQDDPAFKQQCGNIAVKARSMLKRHSPKTIGKKYIKYFTEA